MYRIVGADQKEYGPVPVDVLRQWIAENRANAQTIIRFEEGPWKPLGTFPEFAEDLAKAQPAPGPAGIAPTPSFTVQPAGQATNGFAITGLVFGSLGIVCCCGGPIFSLLGLIFSILGINQINQDPGKWTGKNLAIAGIILSVLGFVFFAIGMMTGNFEAILNQRGIQFP